MENIVRWSESNNLSELNTCKTYELIYSKDSFFFLPVCIYCIEVQIMDSCKFLGVTLSMDPSWHLNTSSTVKKARQLLFFLRKQREFTTNRQTLLNFYLCTVQ